VTSGELDLHAEAAQPQPAGQVSRPSWGEWTVLSRIYTPAACVVARASLSPRVRLGSVAAAIQILLTACTIAACGVGSPRVQVDREPEPAEPSVAREAEAPAAPDGLFDSGGLLFRERSVPRGAVHRFSDHGCGEVVPFLQGTHFGARTWLHAMDEDGTGATWLIVSFTAGERLCGHPLPVEDPSGLDVALVRLERGGGMWVRIIPSRSVSHDSKAHPSPVIGYKLAASHDAGAYVAVAFEGRWTTPAGELVAPERVADASFDNHAAAVIRVAADGRWEWVRTITASHVVFSPSVLRADAAGVALAGHFLGTSPEFADAVAAAPSTGAGSTANHAFFIRLDTEGQRSYARLIGDAYIYNDHSVALLSDGGAAVGFVRQPGTFGARHHSIERLDAAGEVTWRYDFPTHKIGHYFGLAAGPDGGIAVVAQVSEPFDFAGSAAGIPERWTGAFLSFSPDGRPLWSKNVGYLWSSAICVDARGRISWAGAGSEMDFGDGKTYGSVQLNAVRFDPSGEAVQSWSFPLASDASESNGVYIASLRCRAEDAVALGDTDMRIDFPEGEFAEATFAFPF
jgi:hypothetical protein